MSLIWIGGLTSIEAIKLDISFITVWSCFEPFQELLSDVILLSLGRVCSVGQIVQIVPIWWRRTIHIVIPVADTELLIEASFIGAHVRDSTSILITHVEYHAVKFQISVESNGSVGAVKIECDIWELGPPFFDVVAWIFHLNKSQESKGYDAQYYNIMTKHLERNGCNCSSRLNFLSSPKSPLGLVTCGAN